MPNYVYRGTDCPHEFEVYQSFSDDPLTECSECGKPVRRVFQPTGLVFKGSGWYINDSRKNGSGSTQSNGTTSATPDTSGKTDSTATTPASKSSSSESTKAPEPAVATATAGKKD